MKIARFQIEGEISYGVLDAAEQGEGVDIVELTGDPMVAGYDTTGRRFPLESVRLLAPVIPRSKIVGAGKNYADHIAELSAEAGDEVPDEPLLFLKPNTSVIGPGDAIVLPAISDRVEYEGELALIIGAVAKNVSEADALKYVFGFTCANDVTARDLQLKDGQWARAKAFDTFCPLGPVVETDPDLEHLRIMTRVNGELRQDGKLADLIHSLERIITHALEMSTLLPGDVILTGTPAGVGRLSEGDTVEVEIPGIGILRNTVA